MIEWLLIILITIESICEIDLTKWDVWNQSFGPSDETTGCVERWRRCNGWYIASINHYNAIYTIRWFFMAPRWYIEPPIAPKRSDGAIGCDSRPRRWRDDIPAWSSNEITLLSLLPLDPTIYDRFKSIFELFHPTKAFCKWRCRRIRSCLRADLREIPPEQLASCDALIPSATMAKIIAP